MKFSDIAIAVLIMGIIMLIIIPMAPAVLDVLLIVNITLSVMILLTTLYTQEPLQFSIFPSLLLITTLFRLSLNISSTKLILGNNGDAGNVIRTFGNFVTGSNLVVGVIIFLIIIVIQFVVITKGAERVAEVAARFTLDAMPGKQMAIDADLNSGLIDEQQAKARREKIQRESDFYGSMDGASKFVKGDAIVGIIITVINIVGGLIIGMTNGSGAPIGDIVQVYTLATVGDGLVSQIPALLISTGTGIIVTRAASEGSLGTDLGSQLFAQGKVLYIAGGLLLLLSFIPGLPKIPLWFMAILLPTLAYLMQRARNKAEVVVEEDQAEVVAAEKRKPENVASLLQVDLIEMEFGYGLIPLVDSSQGGDLLDRVVMIRRQCALELGIIVPVIRLRDNIQLGSSEYSIKIKGVEITRGEVMIDHFLALNAEPGEDGLEGIETVEPAFGLPALWVTQAERERADMLGYTIIDPPSVIATHLTEIIKQHAAELLSRQQVQLLMDNLKRQQPALVDEVTKVFALGEIQKVLGNLLTEGIAIRDMTTIMETLADNAGVTRDADLLSEYARQSLKRSISTHFVPDKKAHVITLDPTLEQLMLDKVKQSEHGAYVVLEPSQIQNIFMNLRSIIEKLTDIGMTPIVLTSPMLRKHFKKITSQFIPYLIVLSYNELEQDVEIYSEGVVSV